MDNYFQKLRANSWLSINSDESYDITKDCDLKCSEECVSLKNYELSLDILDSCNVNRCNCFYSQVSSDLCNNDCKKSCILVDGGRKEIEQCLA